MAENKQLDYWVSISEYDLIVARSMLEKRHYLYAGFMCHQAAEKMLKAVYTNKFNSVPPYIHKLDKLITLTCLGESLSEDQFDLIDELTPLNIQARYPSHKDAIYKLIDRKKAKEIIIRTKEFVSWLKARLR